MGIFERQIELVESGLGGMRVSGRIVEVTGLTVAAEGLPVALGSMCTIATRGGGLVPAQVVGFRSRTTLLAPLADTRGTAAGDEVTSSGVMQYVGVGEQMLGHVLDGLGRPLVRKSLLLDRESFLDPSVGDSYPLAENAERIPLGRCPRRDSRASGYTPVGAVSDRESLNADDSRSETAPTSGGFVVEDHYPVFSEPPPPLSRRPIDRALATGIRSLDAMHTLGAGQRLGLFAGTGVGKSVLMGMMVRNSTADVIVAALVGERGREVGDFIRRDLGPEGRKRAVLVVSTSDESPVLRVRACFVATAIAEYFRDQGRDVLLFMDSITRMAMAQRQIGLAAGEPPATKGYPPSVFALLPRLLERAGRTQRGSITGIYTVLVEGDDLHEPISDAARGVLDGHLWLSRTLSNRGHYPAVSVLESISRLMPDVVSAEHQAAATEVRRILAVWSDIEDLVNIGAYVPGVNADYDVAVQTEPYLDEFLRQGIDEKACFAETVARLLALARQITQAREAATASAARRAQPASAAARSG